MKIFAYWRTCSLRFENNFLSIWCVRFTTEIIFFLCNCMVPSEPFFYRERLLQQNGDRRKRDRREYCTYHGCSWKQDFICLFASPPLSFWPDKRRSAGPLPPSISLLLTLPPPHALPNWDSFKLPHYILRMASNLEAVSMIADIRQRQWSCTFFRLNDRTLISRVKDFVIWQELVKFQAEAWLLVAVWILAISGHGGPVQTAGTVRERAAHKAGQPEPSLHLGTACEIHLSTRIWMRAYQPD